MSVIKFLRDITNLFNWNTDDNPTSETDYMAAVKNWQETEKNLVDTVLWQPTTAYTVGNMVKTPSLPSQYCLVCATAGTSGANEPVYSSPSVGDSVSDGSVTWQVRQCFTPPKALEMHDSKNVPSDNSSGWTNFGGVTLTPGTWIITAFGYFPKNSSGSRAIKLVSDFGDNNYIDMVGQCCAADNFTDSSTCLSISTSTISLSPYTRTVRVYLKQNSGSTLNSCMGVINAYKLSDFTSYD